MPQISLLSGQQFSSNGNESILNSALQNNIHLPHSCRNGRCNTCRCRVVAGETTLLADESGLTAEEQASGWILSCVRSANTDLTLEMHGIPTTPLPPSKTLPCRINQLEKLSTDVMKVGLRLPPTADFAFLPGQYIEVIGPHGVRRSYSLAQAGVAGNTLELHIRAVPGGVMSDYWFGKAKINDLLRLHGPHGSFFLRDPEQADVIFLATGTGIAPIKAMLESMLQPHLAPSHAGQARSITVLWGGRKPSDLYLDMGQLQGKYRYIPVLSQADSAWTGARGYVQHALLETQPKLHNAVVYACGSAAMVHDAKQCLRQAGLPVERFYADAFVCSDSSLR